MSPVVWCRLVARGRGGSVVALAALHAGLVAWVGWYLAEMVWASAPLGASRSPLPAAAFAGPWLAGTLLLGASGLGLGASALRGPWSGPDPTGALPIRPGARFASAWLAAAALLIVIALAPLPVYLALHELGAFTPADAARPALLQAGVIALAPLAGLVPALARRARRTRRW